MSTSPPNHPLSLFEQTERDREEEFYRTFPAARTAHFHFPALHPPAPADSWFVHHQPSNHFFPGTAFSYGPPPQSSYSKFEENPSPSLSYPPSASSTLQHAVTDLVPAPPPRHLLSHPHSHLHPLSHSHIAASIPHAALPASPPTYPLQPDIPQHPLQYAHFQHNPQEDQAAPLLSPDPGASGYAQYPSNEQSATFLPADSATSTYYPESPPSLPDLAYPQPSFEQERWQAASSASPFSPSGSDFDHIKSESPEPRPSSSAPRIVPASAISRSSRVTWSQRSPSPPPVRIPAMAGSRRGIDKKPPLACLFCRGRKIACGPPLPGSKDKTCNQCQRRALKCEYPLESRRGMRKKKDVTDNSVADGSKVATKSKH